MTEYTIYSICYEYANNATWKNNNNKTNKPKKKKKEKATKDAFGDLMKGQVDPNDIHV